MHVVKKRYRDSAVNGDPTSVLVNGTHRYPDKMLFCPDNECPVNGCPDNEDRVYCSDVKSVH